MRRRALVTAVSLMMIVPLVPATLANHGTGWFATTVDGTGEPDIGDPVAGTWDFDATKMWVGPNDGRHDVDGDGIVDPVADRIYFDHQLAFHDGPGAPTLNPADSSFRTYVRQDSRMYLGFWRDCNGDGYMGDQTTGMWALPKDQMRDSAAANGVDADEICPPDSMYQDDLYINEWLAIGPGVRDIATTTQSQLVLCPDRNPGPSGDEDLGQTPRANESSGVLDGGNNINCGTHRDDYIQDDYVQVWFDLGLPIDNNKPTTTLGVKDGEMRDSNGIFHFIDNFQLWWWSHNFPGLWPTQRGFSDPVTPNQCRPTDDAVDVMATLGNAQDSVNNGLTCSPVPNVAYATLPVLGEVAWPLHIVDKRVNDSEAPAQRPTPITEPFHVDPGDENTARDCTLKDDPDTWDDDPSDGDPFYGGSVTGNPVAFLQSYYGPDETGPSLSPTTGNILEAVNYEIDKAGYPHDPNEVVFDEPECRKDTTIGQIEDQTSQGVNADLKTQNSGGAGFAMDTHFNPSDAGSGLPDASICAETGPTGNEHEQTRCGGYYDGTLFTDVPNEGPDEYWVRSVRFAAYADVSFGDGTGATGSVPLWDSAGDGTFDPTEEGVWDAEGLPIDPSVMLPAGANDAHQYGDEQCDTITPLTLSGGSDIVAPGTPGAIVANPTWSCDRNAWAAQANRDCALANDEDNCFRDQFVGDPYDLRDIDCFDADVLGMSTVDSSGPLGPLGQNPDDNLDCDTIV